MHIKLKALQDGGVNVVDPASTFVDDGVEVGAGTTLHPTTLLQGSTKIGVNCTIGPNTQIVDSVVEDEATVTFSVVKGSHIGPGAEVGPFTHLRPGTRIGEGVKAGAFVEIKGSVIGEHSKVPHLSYVGDAEVGRDVNIGAGTITANYDTEFKTKTTTVIEDEAFTASNTVLVAPVRLGKRAGTGAGSVVTSDVKEGEIVVGIPAKTLRKRKG